MKIIKIEINGQSTIEVTDEQKNVNHVNVPVYKVTYKPLFKKIVVMATPNGEYAYDYAEDFRFKYIVFVNKDTGEILPKLISQRLTNYFYANNI